MYFRLGCASELGHGARVRGSFRHRALLHADTVWEASAYLGKDESQEEEKSCEKKNCLHAKQHILLCAPQCAGRRADTVPLQQVYSTRLARQSSLSTRRYHEQERRLFEFWAASTKFWVASTLQRKTRN